MQIFFLIILLLTFIPVIKPFGLKTSDNRGLLVLTISYILYFLSYLSFWYFTLFKDMYFGYELGDLIFYLIFSLTMIVANFGMGLRNKIGVEFKYFFSTIIIIASIWIIIMIFKSNLLH